MDSCLAWGPARPTADVRSCSLGRELAPRRRADAGVECIQWEYLVGVYLVGVYLVGVFR